MASLFRLHSRGLQATAHETATEFIVHAGAEAAANASLNLARGYRALRTSLIADGSLAAHPQDSLTLRATRDIAFRSASTASCVLLGHQSNGRSVWRGDTVPRRVTGQSTGRRHEPHSALRKIARDLASSNRAWSDFLLNAADLLQAEAPPPARAQAPALASAILALADSLERLLRMRVDEFLSAIPQLAAQGDSLRTLMAAVLEPPTLDEANAVPSSRS